MELNVEARTQILEVLENAPERIVLSNPTDKSYRYKKTVLRKLKQKEEWKYQIERFTQTQVFHENIRTEELGGKVLSLFPECYSQMNLFDTKQQWDYKVTKKGKLLSNKTKVARQIAVEGTPLIAHNRKKNYILQEGTVIPPLVDLGIFNKEGRVVRAMYDKYKQINRFLELVEDVIKDIPDKCLHIIDFGCGKSYLTFILYYYLVELRGYQVHMTGLDLKADVIAKCNATAQKYQYENLHFELGDINGYQTEEPVDMVVTLHACDTATDYALYNAVTWNAGIILSVPCCQHEVNGQVQSDTLSLLTKYGIVKERMSALMTDAIRANMLEYCGYRTQLLEFVDLAHSPKNILIRAVRGNVSAKKREAARQEVERLCREFGVCQTLVTLLEEHAQI